MEAINTQLVDITLIALALIFGGLYARTNFKEQKTSVKMMPLFVVWAAGLWCLLNWIGHLFGVLYVNIPAMMDGNFTYTYHFYSLIFMGVVFMLLSSLQLTLIKKISERGPSYLGNLKQVSFLIILLSLPIIPLNPIGALPVLSSLIILSTVALTKRSWILRVEKNEKPVISPQAA